MLEDRGLYANEAATKVDRTLVMLDANGVKLLPSWIVGDHVYVVRPLSRSLIVLVVVICLNEELGDIEVEILVPSLGDGDDGLGTVVEDEFVQIRAE